MSATLESPNASRWADPLAFLIPARTTLRHPATRVEIVQATVLGIGDEQLRPCGRLATRPALPPRAILAVLTFCYASEIFAATEIEKRFAASPVGRADFGADYPTAAELRAFRQINRLVLEQCLIAVLRQVEAQKADRLLVAPPSEAWIAADARRRILQAACCDSIELDGAGFSW